jgi:parallel beta-helix repeat protein
VHKLVNSIKIYVILIMRIKLLKNKSVLVLLLITAVLLTPSFFIHTWIKMEENYSTENNDVNSLKSSGFWTLSSPIYVDNNWSATASIYDWCSGLGTPQSPYIIENITIDAQNLGSCIDIQNTNDHFKIQNCTLTNSEASPNSAIRLSFISNGKIIDNNITNNNGRAVSVFSGNHMLIEDNHVENNGYGITLAYSNDNIVTKNNILDCDLYGIYLWDSDNNIISENEVNHNGWYAGGYHGIYISESSTPVDSINNTVIYNNVNNNRKSGIYLNSCDNNTIFGNYVENNIETAIYLSDSDDVNIIGNRIQGSTCISNPSSLNTKEEWNVCNYVIDPFIIDELGGGNFTWAQISQFAWCSGDGSYSNPYTIESVVINAQSVGSCIRIENSYNVYFIIDGCLLMNAQSSGGEAGIVLDLVHNGTLSQNTLESNYAGIYLSNAENIIINDNDLDGNTGQGIILYNSKYNQILDNWQSGSNYYGLFLNAGSDNNSVMGNTFQENTGAATHGDGIRIVYSDSNNISYNTLINNDKGIRIQDGSLYNRIDHNTIHNNSVYGALIVADTRDSHDNQFHSNLFSNPSAINAFDNGTNTFWHNGSIGNYWSDYSGVDINDDGIGDTSHSLPGTGSGIDLFPIWDDGDDILPIITIYTPLNNSRYNTTAPSYSISIVEINLDTYYYVISGPSGDSIRIIYSLSGSIDQSLWDLLPAGTYTLTIYANDTAGNLASASVTVIKESIPSTPAISFGFYFILFSIMSTAVLLFLVKYRLRNNPNS